MSNIQKKIPTPEEFMLKSDDAMSLISVTYPVEKLLKEYAKKVVKYTLEQVEVLLENEKYGAGSINRDEYKMRVESSLQSLPEKINKELNL